ncbi:winged helix-turn-helix domain-containing protein [Enterovibrio calviensis]|uniref:winged helix-turn-helix domain-containing protein n=1 Tax=Enterovibrio calviensis TaxID=91359 RepID=UPI0004862106|nr:crosslink repair DNA glycosylase YcaQ family protein [Enterovibrio calviensis]
MQSITKAEARKLILLSQGFSANKTNLTDLESTLSVIERLGYVQIDTISVVKRAHHHVLWSRNATYRESHLSQLLADKTVFEYWAHAASFLPMKDFRFTLPRKAAIKSGEHKHWYSKDHTMMDAILKRIEEEGPLMAKDFDSPSRKHQGWGTKPAKQALENLYMQGELMVPKRENFHKVYDLTERVLPEKINKTRPSDEEYGRYLVLNYLNAHGVGTVQEMTYLLKGVKSLVNNALNVLCDEGKVEPIRIGDVPYFAASSSLALLNRRLNRQQAKILSPFDSLVIQRKRASALFDFDYLIECYVPEPKRRFGYFSLPILWNAELVARADCKTDKATSTLIVNHLSLEPSVKRSEAFMSALEDELQFFAAFNGCDSHSIKKISHRGKE